MTQIPNSDLLERLHGFLSTPSSLGRGKEAAFASLVDCTRQALVNGGAKAFDQMRASAGSHQEAAALSEALDAALQHIPDGNGRELRLFALPLIVSHCRASTVHDGPIPPVEIGDLPSFLEGAGGLGPSQRWSFFSHAISFDRMASSAEDALALVRALKSGIDERKVLTEEPTAPAFLRIRESSPYHYRLKGQEEFLLFFVGCILDEAHERTNQPLLIGGEYSRLTSVCGRFHGNPGSTPLRQLLKRQNLDLVWAGNPICPTGCAATLRQCSLDTIACAADALALDGGDISGLRIDASVHAVPHATRCFDIRYSFSRTDGMDVITRNVVSVRIMLAPHLLRSDLAPTDVADEMLADGLHSNVWQHSLRDSIPRMLHVKPGLYNATLCESSGQPLFPLGAGFFDDPGPMGEHRVPLVLFRTVDKMMSAEKPSARAERSAEYMEKAELIARAIDDRGTVEAREAYGALRGMLAEDLIALDIESLERVLHVGYSDIAGILLSGIADVSMGLPLASAGDPGCQLGMFTIPVVVQDLGESIDILRSMWHFGDRVIDALKRDRWILAHRRAAMFPCLFHAARYPETLSDVAKVLRCAIAMLNGASPMMEVEKLAFMRYDQQLTLSCSIGGRELSPAFLLGYYLFDEHQVADGVGAGGLVWEADDQNGNRWAQLCEGSLRDAAQKEGITAVSFMPPRPVEPFRRAVLVRQLIEQAQTLFG